MCDGSVAASKLGEFDFLLLLALSLFLCLTRTIMNRPDTLRSSLSADGKEQPPFYEQGNQAAPPLENIDQSAGVKRIAAIADQITPTLRIWLFFGGEPHRAPQLIYSPR